MIKVKCPNCEHRLAVPEKYAGKKVRCPKCKAVMQIPEAAGAAAARPAEQEDLVKFRCPSCNQKIGLSRDYAGKTVRCAKCKAAIQVPGAKPAVRPPAPPRPAKHETEVLRAGSERPASDEAGLGEMPDMGDISELLDAEASAPAAERPLQLSAAEEGPADSELPEDVMRMPGRGMRPQGRAARQPSRGARPVVVGAVMTLVMVILVVVVWVMIPDEEQMSVYTSPRVEDANELGERCVRLLAEKDIDAVKGLFAAEVQDSVEPKQIQLISDLVSREDIVELTNTISYSEQTPEGDWICLWYAVTYEENLQMVIVSVVEAGEELGIDTIAAQMGFAGGAIEAGAHSYEEMTAGVAGDFAEGVLPALAKSMCAISVAFIVIVLIQIVSMWVVFSKAGQPGWAAIVPFYNMWVLAEVGDKPGWMGLVAYFAGAIPFVGWLVQLVLWVTISIGVAQTFGHGVLFGLGLTFLPFIFYPVLAFSSD